MADQFTHRCRMDTYYYTQGPQQGVEPGIFKQGTLVALLGTPSGGYAQVRSETGVTAYVDEAALERI